MGTKSLPSGPKSRPCAERACRGRRGEFDFFDKDAGVPVVNADGVSIGLIRAKTGHVEVSIGTEDDAIGPVQGVHAARLVDEDAQEVERLGVKDEDLAAEAGLYQVRHVGDVEQAVRADDDAPRVKVDDEVFGRIELTEELAGLGVVGEEPAQRKVAIGVLLIGGQVGGNDHALPADHAIGSKWGAAVNGSLLDPTRTPSGRPSDTL